MDKKKEVKELICKQDRVHTFDHYDPSIRLVEPSGERDLWASVLHMGVEHSCDKKNTVQRDEARRFIRDSDGMFDVICVWLQLDIGRTRKAIIKRWEIPHRGR